MTIEQINQLNNLKDLIHKNAIKSGFIPKDTGDMMLIAIIVKDLSDALKAYIVEHRFSLHYESDAFMSDIANFFAYMAKLESNHYLFQDIYDINVKGRVEEKFADVVIGCLYFMSLRNLGIKCYNLDYLLDFYFEYNFFRAIDCINGLKYLVREGNLSGVEDSFHLIPFMFAWANQLEFDIMPFIELKVKRIMSILT